MRLTEFVLVVFAGACAALPARAEISAELLDLAGRVHYGFYQGDERAIEAAQAALDRLADSPDVLYYRDFAALRRAQLRGRMRGGDARLDDCARRAVDSALEGRPAAEAWILVAACALTAGDTRRFEQALARAREQDDDHPRIALLEAWALEPAARDDSAVRAALEAKLTAAVDAFDAWSPSIDDPDWGEAEALAALGESAFARGDVRSARDLLERALLLAPDYRRAVALRTAMQGSRAEQRKL
jgi:tetratricopeptide (TPR) repeat protein